MRYVRVTNKGAIPQGGKFAISGLRVFGDPVGNKTAAVDDFTVMRYEENERSVSLSWDEIEGAQGYIVRFGTIICITSVSPRVIRFLKSAMD